MCSADIYERVVPELDAANVKHSEESILGGGRINHDAGNSIHVYGYSQVGTLSMVSNWCLTRAFRDLEGRTIAKLSVC